ncbi:hypothetical protein [Chryseobacterium echinoideorum]|uniref:hypothetical protein n=1 Tax=Chryseobacterium echinoideorum TaxID=1549648 RepID=UPI00118598B1|nr:hypothetical protein [Chryseobacterium echinoideorum]
MKTSKILSIIFILILNLFNAQSITFISEKTNLPIPKVSVFGKEGNILAISDIDGKIEKSALVKEQENFQLIYDNIILTSLSYSDLNKEVIKLDDKIKDIEPVIIKNNKLAKYIKVRGNFNAYVTLNTKLNCYADGVITYIFDNKTKKLKSANVEEYRIFRLEDAKNEKKETASWDYNSFLDLPKLKDVGNIAEFKSKRAKIKELKGINKDEIEITGEALQEKELALFGYRFFDVKGIINHSYEKDSDKTLRDFLESNEISFIKLKHKSETNYNQVIVYRNFYPVELEFAEDNNVEQKVKFNKSNSSYNTNYWKDSSFPNMQTVFSSFFKDKLKEQQNKK